MHLGLRLYLPSGTNTPPQPTLPEEPEAPPIPPPTEGPLETVLDSVVEPVLTPEPTTPPPAPVPAPDPVAPLPPPSAPAPAPAPVTPAPPAPVPIAERYAYLKGLVAAGDTATLRAIAQGYGITRPLLGWSMAVRPILVVEYGEAAVLMVYTG